MHACNTRTYRSIVLTAWLAADFSIKVSRHIKTHGRVSCGQESRAKHKGVIYANVKVADFYLS